MSPCFKVDLKEKSHNFEIEWILSYSEYLVLHLFFIFFNCLCSLYVELIDGQTFRNKEESFD